MVPVKEETVEPPLPPPPPPPEPERRWERSRHGKVGHVPKLVPPPKREGLSHASQGSKVADAQSVQGMVERLQQMGFAVQGPAMGMPAAVKSPGQASPPNKKPKVGWGCNQLEAAAAASGQQSGPVQDAVQQSWARAAQVEKALVGQPAPEKCLAAILEAHHAGSGPSSA